MTNIILLHLIAFVSGFFLDLILGDPHTRFHPVCLIGNLIAFLEKRLNKDYKSPPLNRRKTKLKGLLTVFIVCLFFMIITFLLLFFSYWLFPAAGCIIEAVLTYFLLALKSLKTESMKVYYALKTKTIEDARKAVSMIVGRDTKNLSEKQIIKAAVETIAENASDGVISPMFYLALGGPVLGIFYKCVNTMDSMIAYKNERFIDFGFFAAKTDDAVNFIPSRLCALLMIFSCIFLGKDFSAANAYRIFKRDRFNHESPNSAQTESTMAGALRIQLAGPAYYEGKLEQKPFLGDNLREIEVPDIKRADKLLYVSSFTAEIIFCILLLLSVVFCKNLC